jgi:uncharacterized protein YjbI with pentapeptide repeats
MRLSTPRSPRTVSRWERVQIFVKKWWGFIVVVASAISGLTAYVARIDADRHRRAADIDLAISALRTETSDIGMNRKLDSLSSSTLAEHLEPRLIQGLQFFVADRTRAPRPCAPDAGSRTPTLPWRSAVNHAFRLIAAYEGPQRTLHSSPDRVLDAFLALWHGEPEFRVKPIALARADLRGDSLGAVSLRSGSLVGACLRGAYLGRALLDSARLDSATLDDADLTQASMRSASFVGVHGSNPTFTRADLTDANFNGAMLTGARFFAATLACATFGNARLDSTYFSTANVRWAFFGGARLAGASRWNEITDFRGAYIHGIHELADSLVRLARTRGAAPDSMAQAAWFESRTAQFRAGGDCARH